MSSVTFQVPIVNRLLFPPTVLPLGFSMQSRCVRLCLRNLSPNIGGYCPPSTGGTEFVSALVALRLAAKGPAAYGPLVMVIFVYTFGFHFFEFVSLSGYWCPVHPPLRFVFHLSLAISRFTGPLAFPCLLLAGSEDFFYHPFVSPIVSLLAWLWMGWMWNLGSYVFAALIDCFRTLTCLLLVVWPLGVFVAHDNLFYL